jgi:hypothetical protein
MADTHQTEDYVRHNCGVLETETVVAQTHRQNLSANTANF